MFFWFNYINVVQCISCLEIGPFENSTSTEVCSKFFIVEIDIKFQILPTGTVNVTTFTFPTTHEEGVFLMQLMARGAVIFVCIFSAKYMEEDSPYSRNDRAVCKQWSKGGDQEVTGVWTCLMFLSELSK